MVVGRLQTQSWEKDGIKRQRTEIVASDVNFLDGRGDNGGSAGASSAGSNGGFDSGVGNGNHSTPSATASTAANKRSSDVVIEDLDTNGEINLDDIPF